MRRASCRLACWVVALGALAWPGAVLALTEAQSAALKKVQQFYRQVGDEAAASQLEAAVRKGTITFGRTTENVNAECDTGSKQITINQGVLEALAPTDSRGWQATASLAETLFHEMVHQRQSRWDWGSSYWQEKLGQGNPCEQQAWGAALQRLGSWIRATERELDSQRDAHPRVQAETARRLQLLHDELKTVSNDLKRLGKSIGPPTLVDAGGRPLGLDAFLSSLDAPRKKADAAVALAKQRVVSFDGIYKGTVRGPLQGTVGFKVDGSSVTGRFSASLETSGPGFDPKGTPFDVAGNRPTPSTVTRTTVSAAVVGTLDVDGNLKATLEGSATDSGAKPRTFTGRLSGSINKSRAASGSWSGNGRSGTWSATK